MIVRFGSEVLVTVPENWIVANESAANASDFDEETALQLEAVNEDLIDAQDCRRVVVITNLPHKVICLERETTLGGWIVEAQLFAPCHRPTEHNDARHAVVAPVCLRQGPGEGRVTVQLRRACRKAELRPYELWLDASSDRRVEVHMVCPNALLILILILDERPVELHLLRAREEGREQLRAPGVDLLDEFCRCRFGVLEGISKQEAEGLTFILLC